MRFPSNKAGLLSFSVFIMISAPTVIFFPHGSKFIYPLCLATMALRHILLRDPSLAGDAFVN